MTNEFTSFVTSATGRVLALATRLTCSSAYAGLMSGSSPDADAVSASAGMEAGSTPSLLAIAALRALIALWTLRALRTLRS